MCKQVVILGAGGHAKVIADIIVKSGDKVVGFLDDKLEKGTYVLGFPVLGRLTDLERYCEYFIIIAIGNNYIRKKIVEEYPDLNYYTAIHPSAIIGIDVNIGKGTAIMANAVINSSSNIEQHCIINTGSIVEHDNIIKDYVHISPNAALGGTVFVGALTHIGLGTSIKNNIVIANECIIGAGSVVVNSVKEKGVYIGVPAKKIK